eukprot:TRINITY_DN47295_c0_g1_i1.p1 TRINITY_DN47295_c0_g1~~TRINITY_DN47295_c0_g1_i1.p1  ORF type:complete len:840 (-),score=104.63 TRINITY_DN47295_c0_g1_i1:165-2435(-)
MAVDEDKLKPLRNLKPSSSSESMAEYQAYQQMVKLYGTVHVEMLMWRQLMDLASKLKARVVEEANQSTEEEQRRDELKGTQVHIGEPFYLAWRIGIRPNVIAIEHYVGPLSSQDMLKVMEQAKQHLTTVLSDWEPFSRGWKQLQTNVEEIKYEPNVEVDQYTQQLQDQYLSNPNQPEPTVAPTEVCQSISEPLSSCKQQKQPTIPKDLLHVDLKIKVDIVDRLPAQDGAKLRLKRNVEDPKRQIVDKKLHNLEEYLVNYLRGAFRLHAMWQLPQVLQAHKDLTELGLRVERLLGQGGEAAVVEVVLKDTGARCAVKIASSTEGIAKQQAAEGPYVLPILYIHEGKTYTYGFMPLGKPLDQMSEIWQTPQVAQRVFESLLCGLLQLHSSPNKAWVHADIKPANIIAAQDEQGNCWVHFSDFGNAQEVTDNWSLPCQTHATRQFAEPHAAGGRCGDIWALGVTMITLVVPSAASTEPQCQEEWCRNEEEFKQQCADGAVLWPWLQACLLPPAKVKEDSTPTAYSVGYGKKKPGSVTEVRQRPNAHQLLQLWQDAGLRLLDTKTSRSPLLGTTGEPGSTEPNANNPTAPPTLETDTATVSPETCNQLPEGQVAHHPPQAPSSSTFTSGADHSPPRQNNHVTPPSSAATLPTVAPPTTTTMSTPTSGGQMAQTNSHISMHGSQPHAFYCSALQYMAPQLPTTNTYPPMLLHSTQVHHTSQPMFTQLPNHQQHLTMSPPFVQAQVFPSQIQPPTSYYYYYH